MVKQLLGITGSLLLVLSPAWAGKLYKWTDENGNVHYSDKLPPETVEKAHEELNDRGVTTKSVNREKTGEEKQAEAAAQAAAEAERKKKAEAEARQRSIDERLLSIYTTERDLLLARQEHLDAVDSVINLTASNNAVLEKQVVDTRTRIDGLKQSNKEVPENLTKQLESLEAQITKYKDHIENKRAERVKLEQQFDADLKRYRELKSAPAEQPGQQQATQAAVSAGTSQPATAARPNP